MAEFDAGISLAESGLDAAEYGLEEANPDAGIQEGTTEEEVGSTEEEEAPNPWAWVDEEGVKPEVVRDSFRNYTKKTQELSEKERALEAKYAPAEEFMTELQQDAALQAVIRKYYESGQTPDKEIATLSAELRSMQTQIAIEGEFKQLAEFVESEGLPAFDKDALLEHAADNNLPSLAVAYKDLYFETARSSVRDSLEADIKKSKGAALPKSGRGDGSKSTKTTAGDIAKMSEEEFIENFAGVVKGVTGT
jgi:hypothetical protein